MVVIYLIALQLVSLFSGMVYAKALFGTNDRSDKSADTWPHDSEHIAFKLSNVKYQLLSQITGVNFVWITLSLSSVCAIMICFTIRAKLAKKFSWKRSQKQNTRSSSLSQSVSSRDVKEEHSSHGKRSNPAVFPHPTPFVSVKHEACPRSISQFSCVRSDVSTERQSSQPNSLCPCTSLDYSTGESGYETIDRPTATNTSAETVNEYHHSFSSPRKWLQRRSKLDSWVVRATRRFRRAQHPFHEGVSPAAALSAATKPCNIKEDHLSEGLAFFNHGWKDGDSDQVVEDCAKVSDVFYDGRAPTTVPDACKLPFPEASDLPSEEDATSLVSSSDIIDPIYSKIRGSMGELSEEQLDELFDTESQEESKTVWCDSCWTRHYTGSQASSHISAHPSDHIYYELRKPRADVRPVHPSCDSSVWSIRAVDRSGQQRRHQHHSQKSNSSSRPQCDTPPQLPARLYGQSTVNLVDRLRNLLQPRTSRLASPTRLLRASAAQKAATMSDILDSPRSDGLLLSPYSLTNMLCRKPKAGSSSKLFDLPSSDHLTCLSIVQKSRPKSDKDNCQMTEGHHREFKLSLLDQIAKLETGQYPNGIFSSEKSKWSPILKRTRANSSASSTYAIELVTSRWSEVAAADPMASIRHIDSELDISDAARCQITDMPSTSQLGPSRHIYLPSNPVPLSRSSGSTTRSPYKHNLHPPVTPRRAWSPVDKVAPGNTFAPPVTMSPLMERSMEDDETRHLLRLR
ncbi:hypothetical protein T265_04396 [Opisthorchis viverrini]|uniref:Uncharacterized protein n=1 Tax=Opisthorchis viverrini TaxID=6198 RepID=A0A075AGL9_OPIVI|nr:hypothetical protein T265_04396 [Opisthorchis viverrini]KER28854.1 hypothetical protein T265_04396 [Opisthorchis viverrini]